MGRFDVLLVGHRGTGKTTTAHHMQTLGWPIVDLDHQIECQTGRTCASLVAENEPEFRALERLTLNNLIADDFPTARLIVPGGGCLDFPDATLVVWLRREDWHVSAKAERSRLRPNLTFDAEVSWMRDTREPVWASRADLIVDVPRGRAPDRVALELSDLLAWATAAGEIPQKTWLIATANPARLDFLARALRLRGVERRSDLPHVGPTHQQELVSLRSNDPDWLLEFPGAAVIDIDVRFLPQTLRSGVLNQFTPRPLVVSAHPATFHPDFDFGPFIHQLRAAHPEWSTIQTKLAAPFDPNDLMFPADTLLPIQPQMNGWRAFKAFQNLQNYLAPGAKLSRRDPKLVDSVPSMDLQDWLPYFGVGPTPKFACLVGDPVDTSQGAWWHRREAQRRGEELAYLKINCPRGHLSRLTPTLAAAQIHAVSVTSPLKVEAAQICDIEIDLPALNTLRFVDGTWQGTDTDETGMNAALAKFTLAGKDVLVIGTGGVAPAVLRALQHHGANVRQVSARQNTGWPAANIVINASGRAIEGFPHVDVWIDLHYTNVAPANADVHLNGDAFFEAQAMAQRQFWGWSTDAR